MIAEDGAGGIAVFCAKPVGVSALETLRDAGVPISSVITVSGEAEAELKNLTIELNTPFYSDLDLKVEDVASELLSHGPSAAMSISYPNRIPVTLLNQFPGGAFNFHPARLPQYRGCFPTFWPILKGDSEADYTMHIMEEGFDTGPVVDRETLQIEDGETGWSLYLRLVEALPNLICRNVGNVLAGRCHGQIQDEAKAEYFSNTLPHDGVVDWHWSGKQIGRFVRALYHPVFSGAKALINNIQVEILQIGDIEPGASLGPPGSVTMGSGGVSVSCGDGKVSLRAIRYKGSPLSHDGEPNISSIFR